MTGKSTISSANVLLVSDDGGETGFGIYFMIVSDVIVVNIQVAGAGNCIDDNNKMNVLFRDGTRLELFNFESFNCEGMFSLYFKDTFDNIEQLNLLRTKEIETMRIWTTNSYVERDFSSAQSKKFMKTVDCLVNY